MQWDECKCILICGFVCTWNKQHLIWDTHNYKIFQVFNFHGSVHCENILMYIQQDATLHSLFYLETALHVSGGTTTHYQKRKQTVSTASGICHTVTATCRYRGRVGTGLSVLWVAYATNTRCCRYSCLSSWFWVVVPPETCRAVSR
jgi:hypothetical protein